MPSINMPTSTMVPIGHLVMADYNPRTMPDDEMRNLISSIEQFGFVQPAVARSEDGLVIGGHQRIDAMRRLLASRGLSEEDIAKEQIPVVLVSGVSDHNAKLLNLALNKISGKWDYDKLADLITSFQMDGLAVETIELSGFSAKELEDILSTTSKPPSDAPAKDDGSEIDVDAELAATLRRFQFEVATDAEAEACRAALRAHGMTSASNVAEAFVKVCEAAMRGAA